MGVAGSRSKWLQPLRDTRARADQLWSNTRNTVLHRMRRVADRLPGSSLWTRLMDQWIDPQLEFRFDGTPIQVTEVNVGVADRDAAQMTSSMRWWAADRGDHADLDEEEVELQELVDQTVELMGEAASNVAAMLEDLDLVPQKQRKIILECCRYFHEVYDYIKEEGS